MNKKAQANTFWIVIGAVIAMIVLVVLLLMFTGKTSLLEGSLVDCEAKGGECKDPTLGCPDGTLKQAIFDCTKKDSAGREFDCCIGSGNTADD